MDFRDSTAISMATLPNSKVINPMVIKSLDKPSKDTRTKMKDS